MKDITHIEDIIHQLEALRSQFCPSLSLTQAVLLLEKAHGYVQQGRRCLANQDQQAVLLSVCEDGSLAKNELGALIVKPFTREPQEL